MSSAPSHREFQAGVAVPRVLHLARDVVLDMPGRHQHGGHDDHARGASGYQVIDGLADRGSSELEEAGRLQPIGPEPLPGFGQLPELTTPERLGCRGRRSTRRRT